MSRVRFTTTLQEDLLKKAKVNARMQNLQGANDIIEKALTLYFQVQDKQVWEKILPNGKRQRIFIHSEHTCIDYIEKRVQIDTTSDPKRLLESGYQQRFKI